MEAPEPPPSGVLRTCLFVKEICVFGRVFSPLQKHRLFSAGGGTGLDVLLALSFLWLQFLIPPYLGNVFMMNTCYSFLPIGLSELVSVCVWLLPKDFLQKHESKYLPSNCCWSCFRLGRCSQHWAALIIDLIFRNAYSFFFFFSTHANTLSILPLLIAHESWTWSEERTVFVQHKRTPVLGVCVCVCFKSHEAWIKSSSTIQTPLALCSCSLTAENISSLTMQYLKGTLPRELFRSCRTWDFCQCPLKDWGPFSWSNPDKPFAAWLLWLFAVCLPAFVSQLYCNHVIPTWLGT